MSDEFPHVGESGDPEMVDIGEKSDSYRRAVARGHLRLSAETIRAIEAEEINKGAVTPTIRTATVQAVKHTWETIPFCHQIPITNVETTIDIEADRLTLTVAVESTGKTGCEMEAIQGVTTGLSTAWDMVKSAEKNAHGVYPDTEIAGVRVIEKTKKPVE